VDEETTDATPKPDRDVPRAQNITKRPSLGANLTFSSLQVVPLLLCSLRGYPSPLPRRENESLGLNPEL
jgi:hypothetical protein